MREPPAMSPASSVKTSSERSPQSMKTSIDTTKAIYMPTPPMRGTGFLCTLRASGASSAPVFFAKKMTAGVTATAATMATRNAKT